MLIAVRTMTTLVNSESLTYHLAVYLFNAPKYAPGPTPGSEHAVGTAQTCDVPGGGEGGQRGTQCRFRQLLSSSHLFPQKNKLMVSKGARGSEGYIKSLGLNI